MSFMSMHLVHTCHYTCYLSCISRCEAQAAITLGEEDDLLVFTHCQDPCFAYNLQLQAPAYMHACMIMYIYASQ